MTDYLYYLTVYLLSVAITAGFFLADIFTFDREDWWRVVCWIVVPGLAICALAAVWTS